LLLLTSICPLNKSIKYISILPENLREKSLDRFFAAELGLKAAFHLSIAKMENIKLLFQLYFRPAAAMSDIIDKGSWIFAAVAMLLVMLVFQFTVNLRIAENYAVAAADLRTGQSERANPDDVYIDGADKNTEGKMRAAEAGKTVHIGPQQKTPFPLAGPAILFLTSFGGLSIAPLISILLFFVPALILLARIFGAASYSGTNARNNYMPLSTCVMMAWVAAHLPFAAAGVLLFGMPVSGAAFILMWLVSGLIFGLLTIFAVRTVMGTNYGAALMVVLIGAFAFPLGVYVFRYVSPFLFSPFLIIMAIVYFGGFLRSEASGFGNSFRQRQNFKRFLHNATVNPRDADAHIQLALIYLQRRQDSKALEHLNKAFAIDPREIDANFELGKFARREREYQKALDHFSIVVEENDKHSLSEIWREIGATYLEAGMNKEALEALETFAGRRPFDPEGLYYVGKAYKALGQAEKAREAFRQAVESAQASPDYRRHEIRHWGKLAQKEL
jgi:tetratricopeptide (TPR) repeat protein